MNNYITKIKVNKIFHLENFEVPISDTEKKHLIITGKNGSGKTILVNAIAGYLEEFKRLDGILYVLNLKKSLSHSIERYEKGKKDGTIDISNTERVIESEKAALSRVIGKVDVEFKDIEGVNSAYKSGSCLFAFFGAARKPVMYIPTNPTKPRLNVSEIKQTITDQLLYFLSDLKIQEALARNEGLITDADKIRVWFDNFQQLLRELFGDPDLVLAFEYKDYSFTILSQGKSFKFTELSDGYAAVIEIIVDLILKMQGAGSISSQYTKEGIVIIDEIETHLHLELQRLVLPMLTRLFPNIQFVVTTHSPFILNSISDAVVFDLERKEAVEDLTGYSYEALAEGYFGVSSESSYLRSKLERYKRLSLQKSMTSSETIERDKLKQEFRAIPDAVAPTIVGDFKQFNINLG